ncbi:MAG: heme ABC exporter ATP-binding protein CcmA [Bosea sp. (in: a-proteobacteria)]
MAATSTLTASDLACRRNERSLFTGLSFSVAGGEGLALTGPNGIGKTSLLRILAGLLRAEAGSVSMSPTMPDIDLPQRNIFVSSRDPLKGALSVRELLEGWQSIVFAGEGGTVNAALDAFDLASLANVPCAYLSSGQRRRVSLARLCLASSMNRPVWLLDEPTNALDVAARMRLARVVGSHLASGGLVIAATHDPLEWPGLRTLDLGAHTAGQPAGTSPA